jgi:tetratricopeptide (TPR) repeat protein
MKQRRSARAKAVFTQAVKIYEEKKYKQAMELVDESISHDDEFAKAWYYKGLILKEFKRYTEAIPCMTKAGELDTEIKAEAYSEKGNLLVKIGCYIEAVELFFLLEQQGFNIPGLKNELENLRTKSGVMEGLEGRSYLQNNDFQKALIAFRTSLKKNPKDKYVWKMQGEALEKSKNYREALNSYSQAIELGEEETGLLYNQGICLYHMKNYRKARTCFEKYVVSYPNHSAAKKMSVECEAAIHRGESKDKEETEISTPFMQSRKAAERKKQVMAMVFVFICLAGSACYWLSTDWRLMRGLGSKNNITKNISIYYLAERKNKDASGKIVEILQDLKETPAVRSTAALAIGDLNYKEGIKPLIEALKDKDWTVRASSVTALGKLKASEAVEPMANILKRDIYYLVRLSVIEALGKINGAEAINTLLSEGLKDENPSVRKAVIDEFGKKIADSKMVVIPLCEMLKDPDMSVRIAAANALGELKDKKAFVPLQEALKVKNENIQVQQAIRGALMNISD